MNYKLLIIGASAEVALESRQNAQRKQLLGGEVALAKGRENALMRNERARKRADNERAPPPWP